MNYWSEIYQAFRRSHGATLSTLGFVFSIGFFYLTPDEEIKVKYLIPIFVLLGVATFTLIDFSNTLFARNKSLLPKVRQARQCPTLYKDSVAMLLLDPSPIFGVESFVTIYSGDADFEILIGFGFVANIQENGLIQVIVQGSVLDESDDTWTKIVSNNNNRIKELLVKPSLPRNLEGYVS